MNHLTLAINMKNCTACSMTSCLGVLNRGGAERDAPPVCSAPSVVREAALEGTQEDIQGCVGHDLLCGATATPSLPTGGRLPSSLGPSARSWAHHPQRLANDS